MERILKQGPKRTVLLEGAGPGPATVIKRFHAPGLLGTLLDRGRAKRESRTLEAVRSLGIRAPMPLEVRRQEGHWELVMESIPGQRNLLEVFASFGQEPTTSHGMQLARDLAQLLHELITKGIHHADLHPGNVVLDEEGKPWLLDMPHVRIGVPYKPQEVEDCLVHLCQSCRELTPPRWRATVMACLRRKMLDATPRLTDLNRIEGLARALRRKNGRKRIARWQRESSACAGRGAGWVALSRPAGDWHRTGPLQDEEALARWNALGHLAEHGLPAERPVLLWRRSKYARVVTQVPPGSRPALSIGDASPATWGRTLGMIADRGLCPKAHGIHQWWITPEHSVLAGAIPLRNISSHAPPDPWLKEISMKWPDYSLAEKESFLRAWVQAHRGGARESDELWRYIHGQL